MLRCIVRKKKNIYIRWTHSQHRKEHTTHKNSLKTTISNVYHCTPATLFRYLMPTRWFAEKTITEGLTVRQSATAKHKCDFDCLEVLCFFLFFSFVCLFVPTFVIIYLSLMMTLIYLNPNCTNINTKLICRPSNYPLYTIWKTRMCAGKWKEEGGKNSQSFVSPQRPGYRKICTLYQ